MHTNYLDADGSFSFLKTILSSVSDSVLTPLAWSFAVEMLKTPVTTTKLFVTLQNILDIALSSFLDSLQHDSQRLVALRFVHCVVQKATAEEKHDIVNLFERYNVFLIAKEFVKIELLTLLVVITSDDMSYSLRIL